MSEILHEYGLENRIGYFVIDNMESSDTQADKEVQDEINLWRSTGPIGKLYNIVHWVQRSGQRIEKTAMNLEEKTTYSFVTDNATHCNSSKVIMGQGNLLRNALHSLVQTEVME